jgi:hypothetical protein
MTENERDIDSYTVISRAPSADFTKPKLKRETFAPPKEDDLEFTFFVDDPLSFEQKVAIIDFVYPFFYATQAEHLSNSLGELTVYPYNWFTVLNKQAPYHTLSEEHFREMARQADALTYSPRSLDDAGDSFETLFKALSNTASYAKRFGIDEGSSEQAYAANYLMRMVFDSSLYVVLEPSGYLSTTNPYGNCFNRYRHELCDENNRHLQANQTISKKHQLLMKNDPVLKLEDCNQTPTSLDYLLAHTHFQTTGWSATKGFAMSRDADGNYKRPSDWIEDREKDRLLIREGLTSLTDDPHVRHVMLALGHIMQNHSKYLLLSSNSFCVGSLGKIYGLTSFSNIGFYDGMDSIVATALIGESTKILRKNFGTIAHEALHLIFDFLVGKNSSPTANEEEKRALDKAILDDQILRKTLNDKNLTPDEECVWNTVVVDLEQEKSYWNRGLVQDQETMRCEIIVRPIEQLASGRSLSSVEKIMPNVWNYYCTHCKPKIEAYVSTMSAIENISAASPANTTRPVSQSLVKNRWSQQRKAIDEALLELKDQAAKDYMTEAAKSFIDKRAFNQHVKTVADALSDEITELANDVNSNDPNTIQDFKDKAIKAVDKARPTLNCLSLKGIVANLVLAILSFGLAPMYQYYTTGSSLFFRSATSIQSDEVKNKILTISVSATP